MQLLISYSAVLFIPSHKCVQYYLYLTLLYIYLSWTLRNNILPLINVVQYSWMLWMDCTGCSKCPVTPHWTFVQCKDCKSRLLCQPGWPRLCLWLNTIYHVLCTSFLSFFLILILFLFSLLIHRFFLFFVIVYAPCGNASNFVMHWPVCVIMTNKNLILSYLKAFHSAWFLFTSQCLTIW